MGSLTIKDTQLEMVQLVLPGYTNVRGTLYGGRMMNWITTAATMAGMRVARGSVVLASMDDLDFISPVAAGDVVTLRAQVEHVGTTSLEVGVDVVAENPRQAGGGRPATAAHLALVAVDEEGRPRPVGVTITPADAAEQAVTDAARARKAERAARPAGWEEPVARVDDGSAGLTHAIHVTRIVFPEDAVLGSLMFAGRLMMHLDEAASILALRYCRGPIVTASIDALAFHAPIRVGEIVVYQAGLNYVGRSSMEIGVRVLAEHPLTGTRRHTCTAFLTMVHVGTGGPQPVPPYQPSTEIERRRWREAEQRRERRRARLARRA